MEILEALFDTQHRHIVKPEIHGKKTHYVWYPISLLILVGVIWVHVYIRYIIPVHKGYKKAIT